MKRWLCLVLTLIASPAASAPAAKQGASPSPSKPASKPSTPKSAKKKPPPKKKPKKPPAPPKKPPYPCSQLPWAPILLTSRVIRDGEQAHVVQDLMLVAQTPSAPPTKDARFYLSFGAPGLPQAMRVELAPLHDGELSFPNADSERTRALVFTQSPDSDGACTLLGRGNEAGVVVQLPEGALTDPISKLGMLRVEQTVQLGRRADGGRDLVLRLASWNNTPVRIGPLISREPTTREYCARGQAPVSIPGSPLRSVREPAFDLCVSFPLR